MIWARSFHCSRHLKLQNHYEVLGVSVSASAKEIKKKFFELSKQLHPDRNKDADVERYQQVTAAYTVLSDENERKKFDQQLGTAVRRPQGYHSGRSWEKSSTYAHTQQQRRPGASMYSYNQKHAHKARASPTLDPLRPEKRGDVPHFDFAKHAKSHERYAQYRKNQEEFARWKNEEVSEKKNSIYEESNPTANGASFAAKAAGFLSVGVGMIYLILR